MPLKGTAHALLFSAPVPRQAPGETRTEILGIGVCLGTGAENKHPKLLIDLYPRPSAWSASKFRSEPLSHR